MVKDLTTNTQIWSLGWEDPLEEGMATHSRILSWRIPLTEEPVAYTPSDRKESDMTEMTAFMHDDFLRLCQSITLLSDRVIEDHFPG